jgi:hypothetical protein
MHLLLFRERALSVGASLESKRINAIECTLTDYADVHVEVCNRLSQVSQSFKKNVSEIHIETDMKLYKDQFNDVWRHIPYVYFHHFKNKLPAKSNSLITI